MKYSVGIDIGGTNVKFGLIEKENLNIVNKKFIAFEKDKGYRQIFSDIYKSILSMIAETGIKYCDFSSVGVSVPGSINYETGTVIAAHNLNFYNVPVRDEFLRLFPSKKINILNDADSAASAELKSGNLAGVKTGIFVSIGTGFGGSLILDGKLFKGGLNHGVEPGHVILDKKGELCTCGNHGCFDSLCSSEWISKQGREILKKNKSSLIYEKAKGKPENVNTKLIIDAVQKRDSFATAVFNEFLNNLSSALASLVNLLDPEIIVIGGGISDAGNILFEPLREMVKQKNFFKYPYKILPALYKNDSGMIGAVVFD